LPLGAAGTKLARKAGGERPRERLRRNRCDCRICTSRSSVGFGKEVIDRCEVPEDAKSALWLYGWCLLDDARRDDELTGVKG
jgi:hypothetical protein